ncbi:hypothetical protein Patl1_35476 [Pistacia atlantica]|nr:hypothetical protein Patl1_35476 [Pistacia atlantica]
MLLAVDEARTPPGIAKNPSNARCLDNKYKQCYNLEHVCPKFCPDSCTVNCQSCKPVYCEASTPPAPTPAPNPPTPTPSTPAPTPPTPTPSTPAPTPPNPTPSTPAPTPSTPSPTPPTPTPSTPSPTPPTPTPSTPSPTPPTPTPSTPSPTPATPSPSPNTPSPPTWTPPKKARCKNSKYPQCYNVEYTCLGSCPGGCEVDCATCKPVCSCDKPGTVCQDPRFIGGDGITFYFHGKKDKDFCLVSDSNIHINAHFIGRRNDNMKRDFTWVQPIAILFDNHQLFLGALKTSTWHDALDRLALSLDEEPITLPKTDDSVWQSGNVSDRT